MRVHILEQIHDAATAQLKAHATVVDWDDPAVRDLSRADGLITRVGNITRAMMESAPNLRVVGYHGVGVDSIDLVAAKELGKMVVYTPHANMKAVAELALCFMLAMSRQLPRAFDMLRQGTITRVAPKELAGLEMNGKTAALIGLGRVGQCLCGMLQKGFGMRVVGFAPSLPDSAFRDLGIERAATIDELLPQADYINISVPMTLANVDLIDARRFALCRPEAILVNTSRGGIVNETALYEALVNKTIRAAASDVFVHEPLRPDHPLLQLPNFVATPHVGASTEESLIRMGETLVVDVLRVLRGEAPLYPVPGMVS